MKRKKRTGICEPHFSAPQPSFIDWEIVTFEHPTSVQRQNVTFLSSEQTFGNLSGSGRTKISKCWPSAILSFKPLDLRKCEKNGKNTGHTRTHTLLLYLSYQYPIGMSSPGELVCLHVPLWTLSNNFQTLMSLHSLSFYSFSLIQSFQFRTKKNCQRKEKP